MTTNTVVAVVMGLFLFAVGSAFAEDIDMTGPEEGVVMTPDETAIGNGDGSETVFPAGEEPGGESQGG
ncbi:hypothetical protein, partial [Mesorhizobium sp.]|uniref:hypothetical protein n=1 Tax=Mesorhizobium sp. TaxID=1871066 RepID=UPI00257D01D4